MDVICGVASLKKRWTIQERCSAVQVTLKKGCKDRLKVVANTQHLCWCYGKGERGSPRDDIFTEIFTKLTWKPENLILQR